MNYAAIADEAQKHGAGAFAIMSAQTVSVLSILTGSQLRIWAALNPSDYTGLKAAGSVSVAAEMAASLVSESGSTLDLSDPLVAGLVEGLVAGGVITQNGADSLYQLATVATPSWPGVTQGHIDKALQMRARGDI